MVNPVIYFYEWYLTFYNGLPDSFRALFGLIWGLSLIFFLMHLFIRDLK